MWLGVKNSEHSRSAQSIQFSLSFKDKHFTSKHGTDMTSRKSTKNVWPIIALGLIVCLISLAEAAGSCKKLRDPEYQFYGTKTVYDDARKYLARTKEDDMPDGFEDDSMYEEHKDLKEDRCMPLVLYFIGRHSARFPDGEDIEKYNKDLDDLIKVVKAEGKCTDKLDDFTKWKSKMVEKHDNLITNLGAREEREIAKRLKSLYPEFFDTRTSDIKVGVTDKIRTAQTAAQFLKEVNGFNVPDCDAQSLPTDDVDDSAYDLNKVLNARCYKNMMSNYSSPILDFHRQCDKIRGKDKSKDPLVERIKNPDLKRRIADRVAEKLGLDNKETITPDLIDSIYNMCKFENAIQDDSIWCDLFERRDLEALEYMEDVSSFIKGAYGPKALPHQSCPLMKDLINSMNEGTNLTDNDKRKSYFYFSHASPMKKLYATLGLFNDYKHFSESQIRDFESDLDAPEKRNWRSSVILPFSANMAFVLYKCPKENKPPKYKILTTVNEQPVELGPCGDTDCNIHKFMGAYESLSNCDLSGLCSKSS